MIEIVSADNIREILENDESFQDTAEDKSLLIEKIVLHLYP